MKGFSRWLWKQRLAPEDSLLDVAGAVSGLGDMLTSQPTRPEAEAQRATGTDGRAEAAPKSDHYSDHYGKAQEGSGWHSGASVRLADHTAASAAENEKTPAKAAVVGTSQGFQKQRLRSESNRRWRICNPLP